MRVVPALGGMTALLALTVYPAAPAGSAAPAPTEAAVYFVQMAPQDLELVVDGADIGTFPGRTASNFQFFETLVPATTHTFQVFPAGTGPTTGAAVATTTATLVAGNDYSLISYTDPGGNARLAVLPFVDDPLPAGNARLVVRNTAAAGPVDIYMNGARVAASLADDPTTSPLANVVLPAGTVTVQVTPAGDPSTVLATQVVPLSPGEVADLEVTGAAGSGTPSTIGLQGLYQFLPTGYWEASRDGGVYAEGTAPFLGSLGGRRLTAPVVGISAAPSGRGYWLVAADGGIFTFGDAGFFGSLGNIHLVAPIVGMAPTPDGAGYWLVAADGGIFTFGDAGFFGSLGNIHLAAPIVGMAASPDGAGYWLVAADGGVFTFGDAGFFGSAGAEHLAAPVTGMSTTLDGGGYWLVASDGGVFAYGDADYLGSAGNVHVASPVVGMAAADDSHGYRLVGADGGVFDYGNSVFAGTPGAALTAPVVGVAAP